MSASTAIAISAAAQSGVAARMAHEARVAACTATIPLYEPKTATVEQMREYASCVQVLYPEQTSPGLIVALKVAFVIVLVSAAIGAWRGDGCYRPAIGDRAFGAFMYACAAAGTMLAISVTLVGIYWVIT